MRHRFLFATDDRIAGLVSRFVLHLGDPMCMLAMMSVSDEDIKDYTEQYYNLKFESEYGRFTVAYMPFREYTGSPDPIIHEAFEWYIEYLNDLDDYLFVDPSTISIEGKDYEISTVREGGRTVYSCIVNGIPVIFEPNDNGDIEPAVGGILPQGQDDLLSQLARKIESQLL